LKPPKRWRWPATAVLISFVALVVEDVLIRVLPLATAITINRVAIATSAICIVAGLIGVFQRPKTIALVICGLGVTVGVVALLITVFGELFSLGSIFV
jgi:hypothetical protein